MKIALLRTEEHMSPFRNPGKNAGKSMEPLCLCSKPKFKYMNRLIVFKNFHFSHGHSMTEDIVTGR